MAYGNFTLPDIKRQLHCIIDATTDLFNAVGEVRGNPWLHETLREILPLALAVHTEKSRKLVQPQVSLCSSIDFEELPLLSRGREDGEGGSGVAWRERLGG